MATRSLDIIIGGKDITKGVFASVNKSLGGLTSKLTDIRGLVTGALAGIGVALGAKAIKDFVVGQMEAIDVVAKLSDRFGIQTEAMVGLQHAANLAGVSQEELTTGLEKMLRTLPSGSTTSDAFAAMANRLKGTSDAFERAKIAQEVFGRAGQRLLPLLMEGADGLKKAEEEARKLGLTFSRADARKVEEANDAITKMQSAFAGLARTAAVELGPALTVVADTLSAIVANGTAVTRTLDEIANKTASKLVGDYIGGINQQITRLHELRSKRTGFQMLGPEAFGAPAMKLDRLNGFGVAMGEAVSKGLKSGADEVQRTIEDLRKQAMTLGMTDIQRVVAEALAQGATFPQLEEIRTLFNQVQTAQDLQSEREARLESIRGVLNDPFTPQSGGVRSIPFQNIGLTTGIASTQRSKQEAEAVKTRESIERQTRVNEKIRDDIARLVQVALTPGTVFIGAI